MDELSSRRFSNSAWSSVLEGLSDLKGSIHGANIILCSGGYRVSIHESLVRKFTRVFNNLPEDLTEFKDENGFLVVILPDLNSQSLHALADFLYTGKAVFTPEDVRADLDQLLAPIIQISCSSEWVPKSDIKPFDHVSKSESIAPDFGYSENPLPLWVDLDVKENKVRISKKKHLKPIEDPPYIDDYGDYDNYDDMDYDMSQVTADKEFKCQFCPKEFTQKADLDRHVRIHTGEKPFKCGKCPERFRRKDKCKEHELSCTEVLDDQNNPPDNNGEIKTDGQGEGEKPFKCWLCPKDFNHKGYLERHVKIHTEGKQKRIRRKGVKIKREGDHSEANPDGTDLKSELDLDQKSDDFNGVSDNLPLNLPLPPGMDVKEDTTIPFPDIPHSPIVLEHINRPLTLQERKQLFVKAEDWNIEWEPFKSRADRPKPKGAFVCLVCAKPFRQVCDIKPHIRIHTGEKPYLCQYCPMAFATKPNCDTHVQNTHLGVRAHQCKFCPKRFALKTNCELHMRTHTGEKPYQCWLCPKKFALKHHCDKHVRIHTGEKPFACSKCDKRFGRKDKMKSHELKCKTVSEIQQHPRQPDASMDVENVGP